MKLSAFYRSQNCEVVLKRIRFGNMGVVKADLHLASTVFRINSSSAKIRQLQEQLGDSLVLGGSGHDLVRRLPPEVESAFPDYGLYGHTSCAIGFLTRGCNKRCAFCVVPKKEGGVKRIAQSFDEFVPPGQRNVLLLDDNLLSSPEAGALIEEMIRRRYAVNFSQTLDIAYLTEDLFRLLVQVDSRNARFSRRMIYFSLNYPGTIRQFECRRQMLKQFGKHCVSAVCIYGFDTSLSQDYARFRALRRLKIRPFFQEYWPIEGVPSRLPKHYFDMDLNPMIRLTFVSNGQNWEKYLRWLNLRYFQAFGRFYRPLVEILFRYNNKERLEWYRRHPELFTSELYRDLRQSPPPRRSWEYYGSPAQRKGSPRWFARIVNELSRCASSHSPPAARSK
jgi:hypothetical protein